MAMQTVFTMIKPDAIRRDLAGRVLARFERQANLELVKCKLVKISKKIASDWYNQKDLSAKKEYPPEKYVVNYLTQGPLLLMIWRGNNALKKVRQVVGNSTNPPECAKGTIRRDFGIDTKAKADKQGRAVENLVHASRSPQKARREINFWLTTGKIKKATI